MALEEAPAKHIGNTTERKGFLAAEKPTVHYAATISSAVFYRFIP